MIKSYRQNLENVVMSITDYTQKNDTISLTIYIYTLSYSQKYIFVQKIKLIKTTVLNHK